MSGNGVEPGDHLSDAERGLAERLEIVRADPPSPSTELVPAVARTLRWQAIILVPLAASLALAAGVAAGFRALFGRGTASR